MEQWLDRQAQDFYVASCALANSAGYDGSTITKLVQRRRKYLSFDQVDRIFCAMGEPVRLWQSHPELAEAYPRACYWADEIYPIGVEETYRERQARVSKADYHRKGGYQPRTEEQRARRKARYKAMRDAMSDEELAAYRQKRNQQAAARRARGDESDADRARRWRAKQRAEKAA